IFIRSKTAMRVYLIVFMPNYEGIRKLDENSENWLVLIEDNGSGIPEDRRDEVFLPFSRLDSSRTSTTGGLGLGLAIAISAAKKLSWDIKIDDSNHGGAKFSIVIPKTV
ncbi:ATP-binding protein, partial [Vibrio splendidus]|uniref:ATP-binding protein n=1 Tax=Vibrio splendidus TaxID=29497 RepID=UPI002159AFF9